MLRERLLDLTAIRATLKRLVRLVELNSDSFFVGFHDSILDLRCELFAGLVLGALQLHSSDINPENFQNFLIWSIAVFETLTLGIKLERPQSKLSMLEWAIPFFRSRSPVVWCKVAYV
jgi:hypothetical protein